MSIKAARAKLDMAIKVWNKAMQATTKLNEDSLLLHTLEYAAEVISELSAENSASEALQEVVWSIANALSKPFSKRSTIHTRTSQYLLYAKEELG